MQSSPTIWSNSMSLAADTMPIAKFLTLRVADPEFFIDFEFDDKDPVSSFLRPVGCARMAQAQPSKQRQAKLTKSFFTNLAAGAPIRRFKMASAAVRRVPMTNARNSSDWSWMPRCGAESTVSALAQLSQRRFAVAGGKGAAEGKGAHRLAHGPAVNARPPHGTCTR